MFVCLFVCLWIEMVDRNGNVEWVQIFNFNFFFLALLFSFSIIVDLDDELDPLIMASNLGFAQISCTFLVVTDNSGYD
jgi:hypothetical protein